MATINHWNPYDSTTTTTNYIQYFNWYSVSTSSTTTDSYYNNWTPFPRTVLKKVWIHHPEHWDRKASDAFVMLVNHETNTGWKIEARGDGNIEVIDPYADIRAMKDFIGLLKAQASDADVKVIDAFFKKWGLEAKPKRTASKKKPTKK